MKHDMNVNNTQNKKKGACLSEYHPSFCFPILYKHRSQVFIRKKSRDNTHNTEIIGVKKISTSGGERERENRKITKTPYHRNRDW